MSEENRAVAVAQDVIKHLNTTESTTGYYLKFTVDVDQDNDLQEELEKFNEGNCKTCALGACLLSKARLYDQIPMDRLVYGSGENRIFDTQIHEFLGDIFSLEQMDLIEAAFESRVYEWFQENQEEALQKAICFGHKVPNKRERVRAIMENIITNNGTFIP